MNTTAEPEVSTSMRERAREVARERRDQVEHALTRVTSALQRPLVGASVVGGLVAAAAGAWGPTEAAIGAIAALVAYRTLRKRLRREEREHADAHASAPAH